MTEKITRVILKADTNIGINEKYFGLNVFQSYANVIVIFLEQKGWRYSKSSISLFSLRQLRIQKLGLVFAERPRSIKS